MDYPQLLNAVKHISVEAGKAILKVYHAKSAYQVEIKQDNSPVTEADIAAHHIIVSGLEGLLAGVPVLSEESAQLPWQERRQWTRYWLVDPLDGTKEFISGDGEFTVNIALIEAGVPVLGVVNVPVLDTVYSAAVGQGAFKQGPDGQLKTLQTVPIRAGQPMLRVVASRRHKGEILAAWLKRVEQVFPEVELLSMGSSLKICLVAEGKADVYPRLAPTSEWDTAAAQAVLELAGGMILDDQFRPYRYNRKESILNPHFFAVGDQNYPWEGL